jgi:hypothetical protein
VAKSSGSRNQDESGTIHVRTNFPSAVVVESSWPGSGQHEPDDLVSTILRAVAGFGDDADLEIIVGRRDSNPDGERSLDLDGTLAKIDRLRRLCAAPFDVLEIEDDDGKIANTAVLRASDVIAILDDGRST